MSSTKGSLKVTWPRAIAAFMFPLALLLAFRFFLFEPFIIPSGSMIPNLLIYDHILVNKLSLGIKIPFANRWLVRWRDPQPGEVMVFRYPKNPDVFYVKRLIAVPGDEVEVREGTVFVNDRAWVKVPAFFDTKSIDEETQSFEYFTEEGHWVRYLDVAGSRFPKTKVPEGHYFMMGDNRDQSSDSRFWGFVPEDNLVGKPLFIWLSCAKTLPSSPFLCDPLTIRRGRLLKWIPSS